MPCRIREKLVDRYLKKREMSVICKYNNTALVTHVKKMNWRDDPMGMSKAQRSLL
jgi:hypothetical protein